MNRMFSPEEHKRIVKMQKLQARRRQIMLWAPPLIIAAVSALISVIITLVLLKNVTDTVLLMHSARGVFFFGGLKTSICMLVACVVFVATLAVSARAIAKKKRL